MARGKTMSVGKPSATGLLPWLGLALILVIADQFTKTLILGYYRLGDATYVTSFFNVVRAHNTGAAFSFLADSSGWQRWFCVRTPARSCSRSRWPASWAAPSATSSTA
jgi:signal peptidase II